MRPVVPADKADIKEIARHTWDGYDYLPYVIDSWLRNRDCYTVGIDVGGHIVAMANLHTIDSGRTGWMEALRVHPKHRGTGLAHVLTEELVREATARGLSRIRYTTDYSNAASIKLAQSVGMKKKMEMGVFWKPKPQQVKIGFKPRRLKRLYNDSFEDAIKAGRDLFPEGIIIHDWKANDFDLEGLSHMAKWARTYVRHTDDAFTLSLGSVRQEKVAGWAVSIYSSDSELFLEDLYAHTQLAAKNGNRFVMGIYQPKYEQVLNEEKWMNQEDKGFRMYLFERLL